MPPEITYFLIGGLMRRNRAGVLNRRQPIHLHVRPLGRNSWRLAKLPRACRASACRGLLADLPRAGSLWHRALCHIPDFVGTAWGARARRACGLPRHPARPSA